MIAIHLIGWIFTLGGVWLFQDGLASILYYICYSQEHWRFNHALRIARMLWGLAFIGLGYLVMVSG